VIYTLLSKSQELKQLPESLRRRQTTNTEAKYNKANLT